MNDPSLMDGILVRHRGGKNRQKTSYQDGGPVSISINRICGESNRPQIHACIYLEG